MDYKSLIGLPLNKVTALLKEQKIKFTVVETECFKQKYDTILVVKIVLDNENTLKIFTDRFLLHI